MIGRSLGENHTGSCSRWHRWRPAVVSVLGASQAILWITRSPSLAADTFAWLATALVALQLVSAAAAYHCRQRWLLWIIVGFGLVFRVAAWQSPPNLSSDLYRYIWEGRVLESGESPFRHPPNARELAPLRDKTVWPHVNRPDAVSIYPPGSQAIFFSLARVGADSVVGVKALAGLAELATLLLVALALRRRQAPVGRLILYAWSPLVVAEVYVSGHTDILFLPPVLAALFLVASRRGAVGGVLLGAATLIKLYPGLLLGAVPTGAKRRATLAAILVVGAGYLAYYALTGSVPIGYLIEVFRVREEFNLNTYGFVQDVLSLATVHARTIAICVCSLGLASLLAVTMARKQQDSFQAASTLALGFLLLAPIPIQPWYGLWLVALVCVCPSPAALWLVSLLPLSYLKYAAPGEVMPAWVAPAIWLPPIALVVFSAVHKTLAHRPRPSA